MYANIVSAYPTKETAFRSAQVPLNTQRLLTECQTSHSIDRQQPLLPNRRTNQGTQVSEAPTVLLHS